MEKNWADSILILKENKTAEDFRKMGEKYISDYYRRYRSFQEGKVLQLEMTDYLPLDEEGIYKYFIRIERLMDIGDGLYEIHDYKTYSTLPTQEQLDEDRQLAMYSLWVRREFDECRDVRLVWHFLALDNEMESYRTKQQLEDLRRDVLEKAKTIDATKKFPAKASKLCVWCLYKRSCPHWIEARSK
jgi:CRISPR/Cas system-associated exonuclease Cas4 (RecB family)